MLHPIIKTVNKDVDECWTLRNMSSSQVPIGFCPASRHPSSLTDPAGFPSMLTFSSCVSPAWLKGDYGRLFSLAEVLVKPYLLSFLCVLCGISSQKAIRLIRQDLTLLNSLLSFPNNFWTLLFLGHGVEDCLFHLSRNLILGWLA